MKKFTLMTVAATAVLAASLIIYSGRASAKIKEERISGYVTQLNSPTSFEIDDYKMTLDEKMDVDLENIDSKAIKFDPQVHLKVGTLVKIKCKVNTETLEAKVVEMKIDVKQFRNLSHTTVLDVPPTDLAKDGSGKWNGTVLADARRIVITPATNVRFKLNKAEEREAKEKKKQEEEEREQAEVAAKEEKRKAEAAKKPQSAEQPANLPTVSPTPVAPDESATADEDDDDDPDAEDEEFNALSNQSKPLETLTDIVPGVYMTYKGRENLDGSVVATELVFVKNEKTKDEVKMWKELRFKAKDSKKQKAFNEFKIAKQKYKALTDEDVQDYVEKLGQSLVPAYQRNLPDDDENKIPFRFLVVYEKGFNAGAYATGTVVIQHDVFNYLENEAQLVFLLSHEIAHATQEHATRQVAYRKKTRSFLKIGAIASAAMGYGLLARSLALTELAMRNGYSRSLENQSDRIGLAQMIANGYDPREAPRTWKVVSLYDGNNDADFFWSTHSSNAERRSFLMLTIRNTYPSLDFASMKKDSDEFEKIAAMVREKYPNKKLKRRAL